MQRILISLIVVAGLLAATSQIASAQSRSTVSDQDGTLTVEVWPAGNMKVTFTDADGNSETREFETPGQFRTGWPEMAKKVDVEVGPNGGISLRSRSSSGNADPDDMPEDFRKRMEELRQRFRNGAGNVPGMPNRSARDEDREEDSDSSGTTVRDGRIICRNADGTTLEVVKQGDGTILVINDYQVDEFASVTDFVVSQPDVAVRVIEHLLGIERKANSTDGATAESTEGLDSTDDAAGTDGAGGQDGQDGADGQDGTDGGSED